MGKIKAILDTNILISILLKKTLTKEFLKILEEQRVEFYTSEEILNELARVLSYPKIENVLKKSGIDKKLGLEVLLKNLRVVKPKMKIDLVKEDPSDNKFLECAAEVKAEYVVSGDKHLLKLRRFRDTKIVTAREFLEKMSEFESNR
jgi:hypothetical protein